MVDGIDVGADERFNHGPMSLNEEDEKPGFVEHYQCFKGADMVVIDGYSSFERSEKVEKDQTIGSTWRVYPVYAVYGDNRVVSSEVSEMVLSQYYELWKDKLILAKKKPYILNGDL